jgi:SAM-dependent methyltransferase
MRYTPATHWDLIFRNLRDAGTDLDWGDQWTGVFAPALRRHQVHCLLDLGCGTGNDTLRLTREGYRVIGLDHSREAIQQAAKKAAGLVTFLIADMATSLPFRTASFDAVMSNVALHMFDDALTRRVFAEVKRVLRPAGVFVFHVNALEDRPLRAKRRPPVRELEPNYVLEPDGQTMHFFSDAYLRELLTGWSEVHLEFLKIPYRNRRGVREMLELNENADDSTGEPLKCLWRGVAVV